MMGRCLRHSSKVPVTHFISFWHRLCHDVPSTARKQFNRRSVKIHALLAILIGSHFFPGEKTSSLRFCWIFRPSQFEDVQSRSGNGHSWVKLFLSLTWIIFQTPYLWLFRHGQRLHALPCNPDRNFVGLFVLKPDETHVRTWRVTKQQALNVI